jgi:hypothetical protein
MSAARRCLGDRPLRYGYGPDLPLGTYNIVQLGADEWTVQRRTGAGVWYPLTTRDNPRWRTWSSFPMCRDDVYDGLVNAYTCGDWPHWGSQS